MGPFGIMFIGLCIKYLTWIEISRQFSECVSITTLQTLSNSIAHVFVIYFLLDKLESLKIISLVGRDNTGVCLHCPGDMNVFFWLFIKIPLPSRLHFYFKI